MLTEFSNAARTHGGRSVRSGDAPAGRMELWGGHECTVARIGDRYSDQTILTGHEDRIEDLACFAELGITKLRYPAIWERIAPDRPDEFNWKWTDQRLAEIERLGMEPILGLLHHGSGPRYTSLIDDNFVSLFTRQAAATARRYPHVVDWTPINEPLTTARFSTLYGHWFPHAKDERLFWGALLNQIDATRGAMREIRAVVPGARLIQTEDLGQYYATEPVAGVAAHFNERRWMTWDLLCGRVTPHHALWSHISAFGFEDRLRAIADDPCPPDVIGVNYYPTSERFLDHRSEGYPFAMPDTGYHDLTAARVMQPAPEGLLGILRQAWDRYAVPLAVTECHLGCTREEQVRWILQGWRTCRQAALEGIDMVALTAWALLGNVDWNSLLTADAGHYESGPFDVRSGKPRRTAVGRLIQALGNGSKDTADVSPIATCPGWWERDIRLEYAQPMPSSDADRRTTQDRPLLITGATGTLGQALARECEMRGLAFLLTDRASFPIHDRDQVARYLDVHEPWAVVNAAGWVRVDDAEHAPEACHQANRDGATVVAEACAARGLLCTLFSSDLVFDGALDRPYIESDRPSPLSVYGYSKAAAEEAGLAVGNALVIRTAAFFSPHDPYNFAMHVERTLRDGKPCAAAAEHVITPTYVPDLVRACLDLVVDGERGVWHLTNGEAVSWLQFGRLIADSLGMESDGVIPATPGDLGWRAARPRKAALRSTKGRLLPPLGDAVARFADLRRAALQPA